jgi:oligopeptide transport system substrate-binding protein
LGTQYHQFPTLIIRFLAMNYLAKPFDNVKIRQAFMLSINKDVLATSIYNGLEVPTCHIVPQGMPGYDASLTCPGNAPTTGDFAQAKQLLQQGMQEEGITTLPKITFTYRSNSATQEKLVTTLRQMWQTNLGVTIETQTMDFGKLLHLESQSTCATPDTPAKCLNKGLQIWYAGWAADYPDPQDWTSLQFGKGEGYNEFNYGQNLTANAVQQQATQQALAASDVATPGAARYTSYNPSEQQLVNDVAWGSLFQDLGQEANKLYIAGWHDNAEEIVPPDYWAHIYITTH